MAPNRTFSPKELKKLVAPLADRIAEAIDDGRYEEAKSLALQMENEYTPIIHIFEDFITALLSYIYKTYGGQPMAKSLHFSADKIMRPIFDNLEGLSFRETVEGMAAFFRAHTGRGLRVEEDDEKVTLILDLCGSGGRMVKEGAFDPPRNLLKVKRAQAITFKRQHFPSYCTHCAVFHHIKPIEWSGRPFPPIEVGDGPGNPCKWHFYKNPAAIPDRYYEQVGKKKN